MFHGVALLVIVLVIDSFSSSFRLRLEELATQIPISRSHQKGRSAKPHGLALGRGQAPVLRFERK
jgi:hypothetical protein